MRFITACLLIVTLCCAAPVAATGKTPQEYRILTSTTGDFPAITWLDYWNAGFVGFGANYQDAFAMARDAAARGGWETATITPESPTSAASGAVWVVLMIHTAPPGGDKPPIIGSLDD